MRFTRVLIGSLILAGAIVTSLPLDSTAAQETHQTIYVVQPGDTLSSIARRYGFNLSDLANANGVINPNLIYVGQPIVIPLASTAALAAAPKASPVSAPLVNRVYVVAPGDTLLGIAATHDTTERALVEANGIHDGGLIITGQELIIPGSKEIAVAQPATPLPAPFTSIDIGPLPLRQGSLMEITIRATRPVSLTGSFGNWSIPFIQDGDHYIGLVGVGAHPVSGVTPGVHTVTITATEPDTQQVNVTANVLINPGHFNSESILLSPDRQQLLDPKLVASELAKLNAVWTVFNPERYWNGPFRVPLDKYTKISSPFGTRRSYDGGPFTSYHEGTDFAVPEGTPVYAPADGVVMIAEQLAVRGNAIVIDHGWGVYSGLYHLSEIKVTPGQPVKEGDLVGISGNTGLSTGAHLHWDIRIRGLNVDAMQFTRQLFP